MALFIEVIFLSITFLNLGIRIPNLRKGTFLLVLFQPEIIEFVCYNLYVECDICVVMNSNHTFWGVRGLKRSRQSLGNSKIVSIEGFDAKDWV